jgi:hypothetical protein
VLTLSGPASLAAYQTALDSAAFAASSAANPSRTIAWSLNDGAAASAAVTSTVSVSAPPVVSSDVPLQNGGTIVDWLLHNGQYSSGDVFATDAAGWSVVATLAGQRPPGPPRGKRDDRRVVKPAGSLADGDLFEELIRIVNEAQARDAEDERRLVIHCPPIGAFSPETPTIVQGCTASSAGAA